MPTFHDLDIYGRDNSNGSPIVYYGADAIKNALTQWINSKRGDYLMNPNAGGALDIFLFKSLSEDRLFTLKAQLLSLLTNQFAPAIEINSIEITPDYTIRAVVIDIYYYIPKEGLSDNIEVFVNSQYSKTNFEYEDISLVGFNLYQFVTIKKIDQSSSRLIYDYDMNSWKWGRYKLINLLPTDEYFTDILIIINGS
jgi:phage baseplate assembly protein W